MDLDELREIIEEIAEGTRAHVTSKVIARRTDWSTKEIGHGLKKLEEAGDLTPVSRSGNTTWRIEL